MHVASLVVRVRRDADGQEVARQIRGILAPYFAQSTLQVQKDVEFADVLLGSDLSAGGLQGGNGALRAGGAAAALFASSPSVLGGMRSGGGGFAFGQRGAACAACISGEHGPATHSSGGAALRTSQVAHPMLSRLGRGGGGGGSMTSAAPAGAMGMKRRVSTAAKSRSGSPTNLGRRSPTGPPMIDEGDAV